MSLSLSGLVFVVSLAVVVWSDSNDDCDSNSWQTVDSATLPYGRRAAFIMEDECDILVFGGIQTRPPDLFRTAISLSTDEDNPEWVEFADLPDSMSQPWAPNMKGAFKMQYSDTNMQQGSTIYITCEDGADGRIWAFEENTPIRWSILNEDASDRMPYPVEDCCAYGIDDNIYVISGQNDGAAIGKVQIYDTLTGSWSIGADLNEARDDFTCAMVNNEFIYVFGGAVGDLGTTLLTSVEKYHVSQDSWDFFENVMDPPRRGAGAAWIPNTDVIVVIGGDLCYDNEEGCDAGVYTDLVEVWNIESDSFDESVSGLLPNMVNGRSTPQVAVIGSECDGDSSSSSSSDSSEEGGYATIYAVGGQHINNVAWDGVEKLCFKY